MQVGQGPDAEMKLLKIKQQLAGVLKNYQTRKDEHFRQGIEKSLQDAVKRIKA